MRRMMPIAALLLPTLAFAQSGPIKVERVWSRAAPGGGVGVLFMSVTDSGPADRLTGVSTSVAERAELHETMNEDGVMKMRPVGGIPVSPEKPLTLAPGGYHVMLMRLKQPLREGDSFPVTLSFEKAGTVAANATVAKAGAAMPATQGGMHH
jgi:periplasmic copper chaperone A